MRAIPSYFEDIRRLAAADWDLWDERPDLAAGWKLIFRQIKDPRQVLSELLQNADDAGATEAAVRIEDGIFVFEHNGSDFTQADLKSLCKFGYSDKRTLHTIGFRGIGFKSTFSLGPRVDLQTPTLSLHFDEDRFTEPVWDGRDDSNGELTRISVRLRGPEQRGAAIKSLSHWRGSPLSLLFFHSLHLLRIGDDEIAWKKVKIGPVAGSHWAHCSSMGDEPVLLIRSAPERFPSAAVKEIRDERGLDEDEHIEFPPCKVDIALGTVGGLFAVLPTSVRTALPFACNAPFIQDPARSGIKNPEVSPTNRWLLDRVGRLAGSTMLSWIAQRDMSLSDRASAYRLLPSVDRADDSIDGRCGTAVELALERTIEGEDSVLTQAGSLVEAGSAIALPPVVHHVWSSEERGDLLGSESKSILCGDVSPGDVKKLKHWELVEEVTRRDFLDALKERHLPVPGTSTQLLELWDYVEPEVTDYSGSRDADRYNIVPVKGKDRLFAASDVVRLGKARLLENDDDWRFLASHLLVMSPDWVEFLSGKKDGGSGLRAHQILKAIGLATPSHVDTAMDRAASHLFSSGDVELGDCVRLAQIGAKLGAGVRSCFRFMTRDGQLRNCTEDVLADGNGLLEDLLPEGYLDEHLLHPRYTSGFTACTQEEWDAWISSGSARIVRFPLPSERLESNRYKSQLEKRLRNRVCDPLEFEYPYATHGDYTYRTYTLTDFDFDRPVVESLNGLHDGDPRWARVIDLLACEIDLLVPDSFRPERLHVDFRQTTTGGKNPRRVVCSVNVPPAWLWRFRTKGCLRDTQGLLHKPEDLLFRTRETEALRGVEPFVDSGLDTEATRQLLEALGVRGKPSGPQRLLNRLRALSQSDEPPRAEVAKLYRRIDQFLETCGSSDSDIVRDAFSSEGLIFTEAGSWATTGGVFLAPDGEFADGTPVVMRSVADLSLWRTIGVADHPTMELALELLEGLGDGAHLELDQLSFVKSLLVRYAHEIWETCQHWLNMSGDWVPVRQLRFVSTGYGDIPFEQVHSSVLASTADAGGLLHSLVTRCPLSKLRRLDSSIEYRPENGSDIRQRGLSPEWLRELAVELSRIHLDEEAECERIRRLAERLLVTEQVKITGLKVLPYIDGVPIGTPWNADVLWLGKSLFTSDLPSARLAKRIPEEIARVFSRPDIAAALAFSYERSGGQIVDYMEENFELHPLQSAGARDVGGSGETCSEGAAESRSQSATLACGESDVGLLDDAVVTGEPALAEGNGSYRLAPEDDLDDPGDGHGNRVATRSEIGKTRLHQADLMDLFAESKGYHKSSDDRYHHSDGSWIGKTGERPFAWELHSVGGSRECSYLPVDHCLESKPLELAAEAWHLLDEYPDAHALILVDVEGRPVEVMGARLRTMRDEGTLRLNPAAYRLVLRRGTDD